MESLVVSYPRHFSEEDMPVGGLWVLDHGVPEHPSELRKGNAFPIARWIVSDMGAVLFQLWQWNPHDSTDEDYVAFETFCYSRQSDKWIHRGGDGGGNDWVHGPTGAREGLGGGVIFGETGLSLARDWACARVVGVSGGLASAISVSDNSTTVTNQIEAADGVFVVCFDPHKEVILKAIDPRGNMVAQKIVSPII